MMIDIAKLRELEAKATRGEWLADEYYVHGPGRSTIAMAFDDDTAGFDCDDAAFIAAARNALPALLDEIERLRARVVELEVSR